MLEVKKKALFTRSKLDPRGFTKERRLGVFRAVVRRLEAEGFTVMHEGRGGWEEALEEWPTDAVVYAAR